MRSQHSSEIDRTLGVKFPSTIGGELHMVLSDEPGYTDIGVSMGGLFKQFARVKTAHLDEVAKYLGGKDSDRLTAAKVAEEIWPGG